MNYNTSQHAISSYALPVDTANEATNDPSSESQQQLTRLVYNPYEKLEQSLISGTIWKLLIITAAAKNDNIKFY